MSWTDLNAPVWRRPLFPFKQPKRSLRTWTAVVCEAKEFFDPLSEFLFLIDFQNWFAFLQFVRSVALLFQHATILDPPHSHGFFTRWLVCWCVRVVALNFLVLFSIIEGEYFQTNKWMKQTKSDVMEISLMRKFTLIHQPKSFIAYKERLLHRKA